MSPAGMSDKWLSDIQYRQGVSRVGPRDTESLRECVAWWAEPASWIAGIGALVVALATLYVAFWLGLPQLRYIRDEQKRIRESLTRRAELQTHLGQQGEDQWRFVSELEVSPIWSNGSLSEPIDLWVWTKNVGDLTALDVTLNYVFPASIKIQTPSQPAIAQKPQVPEAGYQRIVLTNRTINPQQVIPSHFALRVPKGLGQFDVRVTTTLRDAIEEDVVLKVRIKEIA